MATATSKTVASITIPSGTYIVQASGVFNGESTGTGYRNVTISTEIDRTDATRGISVQTVAVKTKHTVIQAHSFKIFTTETTLHCNIYQNSGSTLSCSGQIRAYRIA